MLQAFLCFVLGESLGPDLRTAKASETDSVWILASWNASGVRKFESVIGECLPLDISTLIAKMRCKFGEKHQRFRRNVDQSRFTRIRLANSHFMIQSDPPHLFLGYYLYRKSLPFRTWNPICIISVASIYLDSIKFINRYIQFWTFHSIIQPFIIGLWLGTPRQSDWVLILSQVYPYKNGTQLT